MTGVGLGVLGAARLSLLLLACCPRQRVVIGPAHRLPRPEDIVLPVPREVYDVSDTITEAGMRNVLFHVDDDIRLGIRRLLPGRHESLRQALHLRINRELRLDRPIGRSHR
ncbi:MAG TPA: hypothetical protein VFQ38_06710 [Longimicrobiales bacterium]|nr:hypothetical protein [Longimicrobiales bacterium]